MKKIPITTLGICGLGILIVITLVFFIFKIRQKPTPDKGGRWFCNQNICQTDGKYHLDGFATQEACQLQCKHVPKYYHCVKDGSQPYTCILSSEPSPYPETDPDAKRKCEQDTCIPPTLFHCERWTDPATGLVTPIYTGNCLPGGSVAGEPQFMCNVPKNKTCAACEGNSACQITTCFACNPDTKQCDLVQCSQCKQNGGPLDCFIAKPGDTKSYENYRKCNEACNPALPPTECPNEKHAFQFDSKTQTAVCKAYKNKPVIQPGDKCPTNPEKAFYSRMQDCLACNCVRYVRGESKCRPLAPDRCKSDKQAYQFDPQSSTAKCVDIGNKTVIEYQQACPTSTPESFLFESMSDCLTCNCWKYSTTSNQCDVLPNDACQNPAVDAYIFDPSTNTATCLPYGDEPVISPGGKCPSNPKTAYFMSFQDAMKCNCKTFCPDAKQCAKDSKFPATCCGTGYCYQENCQACDKKTSKCVNTCTTGCTTCVPTLGKCINTSCTPVFEKKCVDNKCQNAYCSAISPYYIKSSGGDAHWWCPNGGWCEDKNKPGYTYTLVMPDESNGICPDGNACIMVQGPNPPPGGSVGCFPPSGIKTSLLPPY